MFDGLIVRAATPPGAPMNASSTRRRATALLLATAAAAVLAGCAKQQAPGPRPLTPEAFIGPRSGTTVSQSGTAEGSGGTVGAGEAARPAVQIPAGGKNPKPQNVPPGTPSTPDPTPRSDATPPAVP